MNTWLCCRKINKTFCLSMQRVYLCHTSSSRAGVAMAGHREPGRIRGLLTDMPLPTPAVQVWVAWPAPADDSLGMSIFAWADYQSIPTRLLLVKRTEGDVSNPTRPQGKHPWEEECPVQDQSPWDQQPPNRHLRKWRWLKGERDSRTIYNFWRI